MTTRETILAEIEAFLQERNMAAHVFGRRAMNDLAFLYRLRGGLDLKSSTIDKVRAFMARERARPLERQPTTEARSAA